MASTPLLMRPSPQGSYQPQQQHGTRLAASSASASASMGGEAAAAAAAATATTPESSSSSKAMSGPLAFLRVLWRFTRPHTFIGTALCIPALTLYAAPAGAAILTPKVLGSILWAVVPAGLINVYITGLNQVRGALLRRVLRCDRIWEYGGPHGMYIVRSCPHPRPCLLMTSHSTIQNQPNPTKTTHTSGDGRGDRQDQQALPPHRRGTALQGTSCH